MSRGLKTRRFKAFLFEYKVPIIANAVVGFAIGLLIMAKESGLIVLPGGESDFIIYYKAAKTLFGGNPAAIYDASYFLSAFGLQPYRYFPAELVILSIYTMLDSGSANLAFIITSCALNVFTAYFAVRCINMLRWVRSVQDGTSFRESNRDKYLFVFLILPFQMTNLGMGQISSFVAFFVVLGLHEFLAGRELLGCFMVGMSIIFKPISLFIALFILLVKDFKRFVKRATALIIPLIADITMFLVVPGLLRGFIDLNISEANTSRGLVDSSISPINLISFASGVPASLLMVGVACPVLVLGLVLNSRLPGGIQRTAFAFTFGMVAMFIIQADVWETQLVYLYPFIAIAFTFMDPYPKRHLLFLLYVMFPVFCLLLLLPAIKYFILTIVVLWLLCIEILYIWYVYKNKGLKFTLITT